MLRNYTGKSGRGIAKPDEMLRAVRYIKSTERVFEKLLRVLISITKHFHVIEKNFLTKKLTEKIYFQQQLWGTPETGKCLQMHKK